MWGKSRRGWGLGLRGRSHYYFGRAVHHEIPHCEILHFVPVFLFGMTTLLFLLPVDKICENDVISTRRGVGSFPPQPLQLTNRINSGNDLTLHSPKAPASGELKSLSRLFREGRHNQHIVSCPVPTCIDQQCRFKIPGIISKSHSPKSLPFGEI